MTRKTNNFLRKPVSAGRMAAFSSAVVRSLTRGSIPVLLGGGYALEFYTSVGRHLKDLDLFVYRQDWEKILALMNREGFRAELNYPHWLGKVHRANQFIDIIFSSGNGLCEVDPLWFKYAASGKVFDCPIKVCPPEEMIWSKAFIMERERFDGADIAHLILKCGMHMDWDRLLWRFGQHWRVLLSHIILFDYIYPSERLCIPEPIRRELFQLLEIEAAAPTLDQPVCRGTLLSRSQYQIDTVDFGYTDARIIPAGKMSTAEAATWTAAADSADENRESLDANIDRQ
jgi:Uncharacterised nucleotidyltransferase